MPTTGFTAVVGSMTCFINAVALATGVPASALAVKPPVASPSGTLLVVEARANNTVQVEAYQAGLGLLSSPNSSGVSSALIVCGVATQGLSASLPLLAITLDVAVALPPSLDSYAPAVQWGLVHNTEVLFALRQNGLPPSASWTAVSSANFVEAPNPPPSPPRPPPLPPLPPQPPQPPLASTSSELSSMMNATVGSGTPTQHLRPLLTTLAIIGLLVASAIAIIILAI